MIGTAYMALVPLWNSTRAIRIRRPISNICNRSAARGRQAFNFDVVFEALAVGILTSNVTDV